MKPICSGCGKELDFSIQGFVEALGEDWCGYDCFLEYMREQEIRKEQEYEKENKPIK